MDDSPRLAAASIGASLAAHDDDESQSVFSERASLLSSHDGPIDSDRSAGDLSVDDVISHIGFGWFQARLLVLAGLSWMADATELLLLSFLSPAVGCEWKLHPMQEAALVTVVFLGMLVGASFWGHIGDTRGRRYAYLAAGLTVFVCSLASALSPNYTVLLLLRFGVGIGVGGSHVAYTLFSEFVPIKGRSSSLLLIVFFWSSGAMLEAIIAWWTIPTWGWRAMLACSSCVSLSVVLVFPWVPESPRYLLMSHRRRAAHAVLEECAAANGKTMPPGRLQLADLSIQRGDFKKLVAPGIRRSTILLWALWMIGSFVYYGIILMITQMFADDLMDQRCGRPLHPHAPNHQPGSHHHDDCRQVFTDADFLDVFVTSAAELPGVLIAGIMLHYEFSRRNVISAMYGTCGVCLALLLYCWGASAETLIIGLSRAAAIGGFQTIWVYTPEVYPTIIRSIGMGVCSSMARVGGMATPYVAQVIAPKHLSAALATYAAVAASGALLAQFFTRSTANRGMPETLDHHNDHDDEEV
jgi:MFS family permease